MAQTPTDDMKKLQILRELRGSIDDPTFVEPPVINDCSICANNSNRDWETVIAEFIAKL